MSAPGVYSSLPNRNRTIASYSSGVKKNASIYGSQGLGVAGYKPPRRHRKLMKDSIQGITKPSIRRIARRGGVRRIKTDIYDTVRQALCDRLKEILQRVVFLLESSAPYNREHLARKTVTVEDIIHTLYRMGRPLYGFHYLRKGREEV